MDINAILSVAKKNQQNSQHNKKIGYSTVIKPAKKLERTVNPGAIKAFLSRKKEIEQIRLAKNMKQKKELQKLREDQKHTKKAKAMANRTKDNLKIYHGQNTGNRKKEEEIALSPEAEMRHKAFMKTLITKVHPDLSSDSDSGKAEVRKQKSASHRKKQEKARKAANLNFNELLNLAQQQSKKGVDESSSDDTSEDDSSSDNMNAEERYEKEKRKRKKLEAQLKAFKRQANVASEPMYKIAKLDKGLSEESKQAKVKALMEKFSKRSSEKGDVIVPKSKTKNGISSRTVSTNVTKSSQSELAFNSKREISKKNHSSEILNIKTKAKLLNDRKMTSSKTDLIKDSKSRFTTDAKSKQMSKNRPVLDLDLKGAKPVSNKSMKKATNPYAQLMAKAQSHVAEHRDAKKQTECTLSVTNGVVRTNYPGVAETDPKRAKYQKIAPTREMIEAYRRRKMMQQSNPHRRAQVLLDSDSEEDEFDPEMEGFIDDGEDDEMNDEVSAEIGKIFGYDRSKYGRESEYELSKMDASYKDIEREEKRSLKIAQMEDAIEAKRLAEEEAYMKKRRRK